MNIKASGRSALILATGLWVCFAGPSQAASDSDADAATSTAEAPAGAPVHSTNTPNTPRTTGKSTHTINPARWRRNPPTTRKPPLPRDRRRRQFARRPTSRDPGLGRQRQCATRHPRRAGRRRPGDVGASQQYRAERTGRCRPTPSLPPKPRSSPPISSTMSIARCTKQRRPRRTLAMASAEPPAARSRRPAAISEPSAWDQTSLIGKIFIGFGALLTMASAARMFMA